MVLSWLYSFWDALFSSLGLRQKQGKLLLLGLDNAGKTTLLHRLRTGGLPQAFPPTDRPALNEFAYGQIKFQAWDMGGHEVVRHLWNEYYLAGDSSSLQQQKLAILFVVDAADPDRLEEAGYELDNLLLHNIHNPEDDSATFDVNGLPPVAILLNKCDLTDRALSTEEICQHMDYSNLAQQYGAPDRLSIFRISVLQEAGYQEALQWIATFL